MPQWIKQRSLPLGIPCWFNGSALHWALSLCVGAQLLSHVQLFATSSLDCSPPGSSVHEIFQAGILEWVAISSSRGSSQPRSQTRVSLGSCIGSQILYHRAIWEALPVVAQVQSLELRSHKLCGTAEKKRLLPLWSLYLNEMCVCVREREREIKNHNTQVKYLGY